MGYERFTMQRTIHPICFQACSTSLDYVHEQTYYGLDNHQEENE